MPDVNFGELSLESGHAGALAFSNAAEDLAFSGPIFPKFRRSKVGSVGDHVDGGFTIGAMATGAIAREQASALGDGFFGIGNGAGEFLGVSYSERVGDFRFFVRKGDVARGDEHTAGQQHSDSDGLSQP